jgi:predicted HAD superfamily Cof-like phosphohydrolase
MSVKPKQLLEPPLTPHERRVKAMMLGFGQRCPASPTVGPPEDRISRARLKLEETLEYLDKAALSLRVKSLGYDIVTINLDKPFDAPEGFVVEVHPDKKPDLVGMMDALGDDSVVNTGSFVAHGVRMTPILEAIDENNLMKIANGKLDDHGKFQKAKDHPVVNLEFALALQGYDPEQDPYIPGSVAEQFAKMVNPQDPHYPPSMLANDMHSPVDVRAAMQQAPPAGKPLEPHHAVSGC